MVLYNPQRDRNVFVLFVFIAFTAVLAPLPYMSRVAIAQKDTAPVFERVDQSKDGYIDRSEAEAAPALAAQFDELDRNGDRRIDKIEFARGRF